MNTFSFLNFQLKSIIPEIVQQQWLLMHYKLNAHFITILFYVKSFANSFSLALQRECAPYGIKVQLLMPFIVITKMLDYSPVRHVFTPDVETYSRWAVFTLGKTSETTGYWAHAIQVRNETIQLLIHFPFNKSLIESM